jgi:hypothetical protein
MDGHGRTWTGMDGDGRGWRRVGKGILNGVFLRVDHLHNITSQTVMNAKLRIVSEWEGSCAYVMENEYVKGQQVGCAAPKPMLYSVK